MKMLFRIVRTELQLLFYSPVAWIVLAAFILQASFAFIDIFENCFFAEHSPYPWIYLTKGIFASFSSKSQIKEVVSFFPQVLKYLYLYIPLLTMNLMSRELQTGSINLLYSSPVAQWQLIGGKYVAIMIYALMFIAILFIYCLFAASAIEGFDFPFVLAGLLGFFLLIGVYAAIGLFMSSLTSDQTVAVISTLLVLFVLNGAGSIGKELGGTKDVLQWLSIEGQMKSFMEGSVRWGNVSYFLVLMIAFLTLAILRLRYILQKMPLSVIISKYVLVLAGAFLLLNFTSRLNPSVAQKKVNKLDSFIEVGFVQGHGERDFKESGKDTYREFRLSFMRNNFVQTKQVKLDQSIPENVKLLVIADVQKPLMENERRVLEAYIARGGDVWILGEPGKEEVMNPLIASLGVEFLRGRLVSDQEEPDLVAASSKMDFKKNLMLPGCAGLKYFPDKGFTVQVLFESTPNGWNEVESTKFKKKTDIRLNAAVGEVKQAYPVVLRLTREQNGEQQQIYIFGDADCLSNFNIHRYNRDIVQELLGDRLITYSKKTRLNKSISVPKGKKESLRVTLKDLNTWQIILGGVFPAVCVLIAFVIWKRRMNR